MSISPVTHTPVVAGAAYFGAVQRLHANFTVTLQAEPDNRFSRTAVAVLANGEKIGYLPPDISRHYFEFLKSHAGVECPGRRGPQSAHENTGVDVLLDLTGVPCTP